MPDDIREHVETSRFGPFTFQVGVDEHGAEIDELRRAPWHEALYAKLGDKTKQRDLSRLCEQELLYVDEKGLVWPGFTRSK